MARTREIGLSSVENPELENAQQALPREPYLSVVIPVFDERESLAILHRELAAVLDRLPGASEMIFVDDGSRDGSLGVLRSLELEDERVRTIVFERNCGQSAALDAGFRAARGEITATLDADLQNDPREIPKLLGYLDRADVVNGVRVARKDSWLKRLSSRIANAVRNWATGADIVDVGCSLRVMRTCYLRRIRLYRGMHRFLPTLLSMQGARLCEVEVSHRPRRFGRSKYGLGNRLFMGLADLLAVCWMQRRSLR